MSERNEKLIEMCETGQYTLQEVGEKFGISKQRVSEIYKKPYTKNRERKVQLNKQKLIQKENSIRFYCKACGVGVLTKDGFHLSKLCRSCHDILENDRNPYIKRTCPCGREFHPIRWERVQKRNRYCSRKCYHTHHLTIWD